MQSAYPGKSIGIADSAEMRDAGLAARVGPRGRHATAVHEVVERRSDQGEGRLLGVAGNFPDVRVYQIADQSRVARICNVPAPIFSISLNADGSRLAVGSKVGQVQIYELPGGKMLKSFIPVPLTPAGDNAGGG